MDARKQNGRRGHEKNNDETDHEYEEANKRKLVLVLAKVLPQDVKRLRCLADSDDVVSSVLIIDTILCLIVAPIPLEGAVCAVALQIRVLIRVTAAAAALEYS